MHSLTWVPHLDQVCLNAFCSICRFICFIQSLFVSQPSRYERSGQCNRFCWNTKLSWKSQLNLWISEISTGHICWYLRTYLPCTTYFDTYFMFDSYTEIYIYVGLLAFSMLSVFDVDHNISGNSNDIGEIA